MDLVGKSSALVTVPIKNYFVLVVLIPAVPDIFFAETSALVTAINRGKRVAS